MDLADCVPRDKHDLAAVERARSVGFPALAPLVPSLLNWIQDLNWPVAIPVRDLLAEAGNEIIEPIRMVLRSEDGMWIYWILSELAPRLRPDVITALRPGIESLLARLPPDDPEEIGEAARAILSRH